MRAFLAVCLLASGLTAQGDLRVVTSVFSFGKRPQADEFRGRFELLNRGNKPVTISRVVPLCRCAKVVDAPRQLKPGESGIVVFDFFTRQFEGDISKTIEVHHGSKGLARLVLTVRGEVVPKWRLLPSVVQLGGVARGQALKAAVELLVAKGEFLDFELSSRTHGVTVLPAKLRRVTGKQVLTVEIVVGARRQPGPLVAEIAIKSSDQRKPSDLLRVLGRIEGDLHVAPRQLSFGRVRRSETVTRKVTLRSIGKRPFRLLGDRTEGVVLGNGQNRRASISHEIVLSLQSGLPFGWTRGRYILLTDHPDEPEVVLEYAVLIVKK